MKSIMLVFPSLLTSTMVLTQSHQVSKKSKQSKSEKKIKIKLEKDVKLDLKVNQEVIVLELTHPKKFTPQMKNTFTKYFGNEAKKGYKWDDNSGSSILLKKNKVSVHINQDQIDDSATQNIKRYVDDVFYTLDWDTNALGLWEYSGDWSLVK